MNMAIFNMEFYMIYTAVFLLSNIEHGSSTIKVANQSSSNCVCSEFWDCCIDCQCPDEEIPKITINANLQNHVVKIHCSESIDWNIQELLPSLEFGNVYSCRFRQCPLPTSFVEIMNSLKVNSTNELKFDYCRDFANTTLNADHFKGLHNLEKLSFNYIYVENIHKETFKSLGKLKKLDLSHNKIQLTNGLFKDLSNLKSLSLADNEIPHLPSGIFQNLTQLTDLGLSFNRLTKISSSIFKDLRSLKLLQLVENQLEDLPENVFHYLENLKGLDVSANRLQTIPEKLFNNAKLIETVMMNRNPNLTYLPNNLFSNLTQLNEISLNECRLTNLSNNLFGGSLNLQIISLRWNAIEYIPENIFMGLEELRYLDLSYNKIGELPDKAFSSLVKLKTFNFQNNFLTNIRSKDFYNLKTLEILNLKNNKIFSVEATLFRRLDKFSVSTVASNDVEFPVNVPLFANNVHLKEIDLSGNNITIMGDFAIFTRLEKLDLSYNQISDLNFTKIFTLASPIHINLKNNNITKLHFPDAELMARGQVDSNTSRRRVSLNGNPIQCDCHLHNFVNYLDRATESVVPELATIDDAASLTCSSPNNFLNVPVTKLKPNMLTCSLQDLGITDKFSDKCSYKFRTWDKSLIVNCTNLNLTQAPKLLLPTQNFFNQTEVHLENNILTSGPRENVEYENVTKLFLSSNNISEVTWIPPKLKILELHNNNISYLSQESLERLISSAVTMVTLGKNPWKCDCSTINVITFLKSNSVTKKFQIDTNYLKCKESGKSLIDSGDICPTNPNLTLGCGIAFSLIGLLVATLLAIYYRFQQQVKVWLFVHNMFLGCCTEYEIDKDKLYDAFVSYSYKDEDFVLNELVPVLENNPQPYKLCLHIRDFVAGELIYNQIATSVEKSRRTLVILSRNFLHSEWGKMEFRTANKQAMNEKRARVILILYGDIDVDADLDDEFKAYARTNTYLKWGDPWFWDKLRYALPHSRQSVKNMSQKSENIMGMSEKSIQLDDTLDLTNDSLSTTNPLSTPPVNYLFLKDSPLSFQSNANSTS